MAAMSKADQDFAQKAGVGGLAEEAMGQLARQNRGSARAVRVNGASALR